jgi:hypothetical protein
MIPLDETVHKGKEQCEATYTNFFTETYVCLKVKGHDGPHWTGGVAPDFQWLDEGDEDERT